LRSRRCWLVTSLRQNVLTCSESVAQHGYRTVAMLHLHSFEKMGMGSQCGRLLFVENGKSGSCVTGTLRDVVKIAGTVMVGRRAETVSGSSGVSSSCGYGTATTSAARAPSIIARRMVRFNWGRRSCDEACYCKRGVPMQWCCFPCLTFFYLSAAWFLYLVPDVHIEYFRSLQELYLVVL
jgi:hypothetical protein